jgi:spore coat protein H
MHSRLIQIAITLAGLWSLTAGARSAKTADDDIRGRDATPDYRRVFAQDSVGRLDLRISAGDWQALLTDMEEMAGPFGSQGGRLLVEPSAEAVAACTGLLEGAACSFGTPSVSGRCALLPTGGLACAEVRGNPGGGANPDEPGRPPDDVDPEELLPRNPIYVPAQVTFDGETFDNVGFRLKGNAALLGSWRQGREKLPFRLNLDRLEDRFPEIRDQTFFGFPNLTFNNGGQDTSYLRNKIVTDLFLEAGVPAAQTAFMRVFLDRGAGPIYLGLYTMIEIPDRPMLDGFFGSDDGNLYKPVGTGARWTVFDRESFSKRTNEEDGDWTDIAAAIAALNAPRDDAARWRSGLEARFNVDGFLRWLALNTIVGNGDAYGGLAHNYYLYGSPRHRDRLFWIPWDHDLALRAGGPGGGSASAVDLFHRRVASNWPLIRFLMDDPVYGAAYRQHVEDLLATVFVPSRVKATIQSEHARIARYVIGDEGEDPSRSFAGSPQQFDSAVYGASGLLATVEIRAAAVRRALESTR